MAVLLDRSSFVIVLSILLIQGQSALPNPAGDHQVVKRQSSQSSTDAVFVNDLGDFLSSLISTGLRGAAAFLTASSEASQKVAVAVGSAAIPPLLNVTRSFSRVQDSSRKIMNSTSPVVPSDANISTLTKRVNQGVRPAVETFNKAFNQTFRPSSGSGGIFASLMGAGRNPSASSSGSNEPTRVNPNDSEIPDVIDWDN